MKKALFVTAIAALSISAAACSKKTDTAPSTTAAPTAETTVETVSGEDVDEVYTSGIIIGIEGDILTVKDDFDESKKKYDISRAEVIKDYPLSEGDWLDITYPEGSTEEPIPAIAIEITTSMIEQSLDPQAEGKIIDASMGTVTLETNDETYTFLSANAYIVAKDGIKTDENATIYYLGELDDEPMALKIVMEDSYDTPEAEKNAFVGEVAQVAQSGKEIVLQSSVGDFYTFVSNNIDFKQYSESQTLQIEYTGSISDKEIAAVSVTKK